MEMGLRSLLLVVAVTLVLGAVPAAAKEGVKATLTTKIPLNAAQGTPLEVGWTLAYLDENGRRQPFGAGEVFVRLLSASGARAQTTFIDGSGTFSATVAVPEGGIGDVQIGLRGYVDGRPSDLLFPITNDPMPGNRRVAAPPSAAETDGGSRAWVFAVVAGSLLAIGVVCLVAARTVARRRHVLEAR
jgi:hypothetical protein